MFTIDTAILVSGILLLLGIASSKFSARLGMPVLVMFLGLGMLAGSEGIGGIAFEDYSLAEEVVVALIVRNQQTLMPKGSSLIQVGDHVIVVLRPSVRPLVDRIFAGRVLKGATIDVPIAFEFPLKGSIKVSDLAQFYDIEVSGNADDTLDHWIRQKAGEQTVTTGFTVHCDRIRLSVRNLTSDGKIEYVGMTFLPESAVKAVSQSTAQEKHTSNLANSEPVSDVPAKSELDTSGD